MLNQSSSPVQIRIPPMLAWPVPQRRAADRVDGAALTRQIFAAAFDETDNGTLFLSAEHCGTGVPLRVLHANQVALLELDEAHPLLLVGDELHVRHAHDAAALHDAVRNARLRNLRKLLRLDADGRPVSVSVVPLPGAVLLMLGKRQMCEELTVHGYAASCGLTPAESRVLAGLCRGESPERIAADLSVQISTVRTQIGSIRLKSGACSISALVRLVSVLPPLRGVLRASPCRQAA